MRQPREQPHPAVRRIREPLPLVPIHGVEVALQLGGRGATPRLGPPLPGVLRALHRAVVLRPAHPVGRQVDPQAQQPQPQLRRQASRRDPGLAVVHADSAGQAPVARRPGAGVHGPLRRHVHPVPRGKKRGSAGRRRCIHRRSATSRPRSHRPAGSARKRPSARRRGGARRGAVAAGATRDGAVARPRAVGRGAGSSGPKGCRTRDDRGAVSCGSGGRPSGGAAAGGPRRSRAPCGGRCRYRRRGAR